MVCAGLDPTVSGVWSHIDRLTMCFSTRDLLLGLRNMFCVELSREEKRNHMWEVTKGLRQTVMKIEKKLPNV